MSRIAVLGILLLVVGCAGGGQRSEIPVGEYGSLTGLTATYGISTKNGSRMAFDEANAAGGVLGKKIDLTVEDDSSKPEEAANAVIKLINQDRVVAVLGEVASSRSLAGAPYCQQAGVPMLSPSSTNPEVTKKGDYIFRACFTDDFQGKVVGMFATDPKYLGLKRLAVLYDVKNDYSKGLTDVFTRYVQDAGGQIVAKASYSEGDKDFRAQLTDIKAESPDAIYVPGYYQEAGLIARQARELKIPVPLMGSDGWDSPALLEVAGHAIEGCYMSNHYSVDDPSERVQKFVRDYKKRFGQVPDALAALGYDAAGMLVSAIKRAGTTQGKALRDALASTKDYPGVTGNITLDADRNAKKPAVILKFEQGQWRFVTRLQPD
jgi:branched-chain amino acid transport system substrate-binding protein